MRRLDKTAIAAEPDSLTFLPSYLLTLLPSSSVGSLDPRNEKRGRVEPLHGQQANLVESAVGALELDELAEVETLHLEVPGAHGPDSDVDEAVGDADDAHEQGPPGGNRRGVLLRRDRFTRVGHGSFSGILMRGQAPPGAEKRGPPAPCQIPGRPRERDPRRARRAILANNRTIASFFCPAKGN